MNGFEPGLSAVMIVKNAGSYLSTALRSLRRVADEIVVVDTGSTDRTIEIAEQYNCRIFGFEWCDDFSKAKNYAVSLARFEWILNVDADEVLYDVNAGDILAGAIRADAVPAYVLWIDSLSDNGPAESTKVVRLFRNDPRIRFTNPVHESICESLYASWPGFVPPVLDIHLRHYGYLSHNRAGKHERNISLLRQWVAAEPDNIYANYKFGGTLVEIGLKEEAILYLGRAFRLFEKSGERGTYPFLRPFLTLYCDLLTAEGSTDKAEQCRRIAAGWF